MRSVGKLESSHTARGNALENHLAVLQQTEHRNFTWPCSSTPGNTAKGIRDKCYQDGQDYTERPCLQTNKQTTKKIQTKTKRTMDGWMGHQSSLPEWKEPKSPSFSKYTINTIKYQLVGHKKEQRRASCCSIDQPDNRPSKSSCYSLVLCCCGKTAVQKQLREEEVNSA